MKFSLILATLSRSIELIPLLNSLKDQKIPDFELIVIDQNKGNKIQDLLTDFRSSFPITYRKSNPIGLSRARNLGLDYVNGEVIGFPDDDCWFPPNLLTKLSGLFKDNQNIDVLTGRVVDENGQNIARFATKAGIVKLYGIWERTSAVAIFYRRFVIEKVGRFDETLGLGAGTPWGGGEDLDYPIRAFRLGFKIFYDPDIIVYHPRINLGDSQGAIRRAYSYGAGFGRVWRKHNFPYWLVGYYLLRPFGGFIRGLMKIEKQEMRYYWGSLMGRWKGWRSDWHEDNLNTPE